MPQITIDLQEDGTGQFSVDGSEPQPFKSAEEVCSVIEQMAGQSDGDEQSAMNAGFNQARGMPV